MTLNQISIPLLVAIPTGTYLITHGDLRFTVIMACGTAIGIVFANFVNGR